MGRAVNVYAIDTSIKHEKTKKICMNWEWERTQEEYTDDLFEHLYPNRKKEIYDNVANRFEACSQLMKEKEKVADENECYKYEDRTEFFNQDWCPRCSLFYKNDSFYLCPIVLDVMKVNNSDSISDWHFSNMYPGVAHTDFCNRFGPERTFREVSMDDIDDILTKIKSYGTPYTKIDKEALHDTEMFINFCKRWLEKDDIIVLYNDEY